MPKPTLYVFTISHYCEKARWALDYFGIDYDLRPIAPGVHAKVAQKLKCRKSSVPILVNGAEVIQDSTHIISWAEENTTNDKPSLLPPEYKDEVEEIEKRLDDISGVHIRRLFYSEALVNYPETVKPIFLSGIPFWQRLLVHWKWNFIRNRMIKLMDLGDKQYQDSKNIIADEIKWLDELASKGSDYLVGDKLTRADLALASLYGPLVDPVEHPIKGSIILPPNLKNETREWLSRPSMMLVREIYKKHR